MTLTTPLAQFLARAKSHPSKPYLHQPIADQWRTYSWQEVEQEARKLASALLSNGCTQGDRVAILGKNSAEWVISDIAIMMAGLISVPVYATAGESTLQHVLSHSESKILLLGNLDNYSAVEAVTQNGITIFNWGKRPFANAKSWQDQVNAATELEHCFDAKLEDTLSITYTSGSSGLPKGVVLSYGNLGAQAISFKQVMGNISQDDHRALSYLPLAHITERSTVEFASFYAEVQVYFNAGLDTFLRDLKHAKPTLFLSVPRLWMKFQQGVLSKTSDSSLQFKLGLPIIGKFVGKQVLKKLGLDQVIFAGCGSAPVSPDTLRWYQRLGLNITEGWGMTETCGVACTNLPFTEESLGTIGKPMPGFEMKTSEQGEILIKGDGIFTRYYRNPEATEEAFDNGWFKTGDKGVTDENGNWKITGRVKETFKTAKGKFVNPVPIERLLAVETRIEQTCVMGQGRGQPIALVVMNESISGFDEAVNHSLADTLKTVNSQLEAHQKVDSIVVCKQAWGIDEGLLTPTLKLKRDNIYEKYQHLVDKEHNQAVIWE